MRTQIVKLGSNCLLDKSGALNYDVLRQRAIEISEMSSDGLETILVISGAIKLAKKEKGDTRKTEDIPVYEKSAYASWGQTELMSTYNSIFKDIYGKVSQFLVTQSDLKKSSFADNIRNTVNTLIRQHNLAAFNTDDTRTHEEINTDNDTLAAMIAEFMGAESLIILGHYDGLCKEVNNPDSLVKTVYEVTNEHFEYCNGSSNDGTGGFETKLVAGNYGIKKGFQVIIGNVNNNLYRTLAGENATRFIPPSKTLINNK